MIKINKTDFNTYEIVKGNCHPVNRIGNLDKKDLIILWTKIGKLIGERDYKAEIDEEIKKFRQGFAYKKK